MATVRKFANNTKISSTKTLEDLRKLLTKYGCSDFAHLERKSGIHILFTLFSDTPDQRNIRFSVGLPDLETFRRFRVKTPTGGVGNRERTDSQSVALLEQERARIYRALLAVIKGRLLAVDENIQTIEQAFYGETVADASGATVYEVTKDRLAEGYRRNQFPDLMPNLPQIAGRTVIPALSSLDDE
jgi:hypothetical protein